MKIAVTGANGFIGQNLMRDLPFEMKALTREQLGDFEQVKDWAPHLKNHDTVIHLAARVHEVSKREQNAEDYRYANTVVTKNILYGALEAGVKNFIFMSSAAVYGTGQETPFKESDTPKPKTEYGKSKFLAERLVEEQGKDLRFVIIRAPMIYGPGCRANFTALAKAIKFHVPLPLASVKNRRSLLGIENLVSFVAFALNAPEVSGVYNVADSEDISTPELIRTMAGAMNRQAVLYPFPPVVMQKSANIAGMDRQAEGLLGSFLLDAGKARATGWRPTATLSEGVKTALSGF